MKQRELALLTRLDRFCDTLLIGLGSLVALAGLVLGVVLPPLLGGADHWFFSGLVLLVYGYGSTLAQALLPRWLRWSGPLLLLAAFPACGAAFFMLAGPEAPGLRLGIVGFFGFFFLWGSVRVGIAWRTERLSPPPSPPASSGSPLPAVRSPHVRPTGHAAWPRHLLWAGGLGLLAGWLTGRLWRQREHRPQ